MADIDLENRTREQLLALYQIGRVMNSSLELQEVLDGILETTLSLFQAEAGSILMLEQELLRIAAARGLTDDIIASTGLKLGEGIAGWVAQNGEAVQLHGKVEDPRFSGLVSRSDEITSSMCTPLRHRDQMVGVLSIRRGGTEVFSADQMDFLSSVADQAALALVNARLFESERQRADELNIERQKLETVLASMADGVVVLDALGRVILMNPAARRFLGESALGANLVEFCPSLGVERLVKLEGSLQQAVKLEGRSLQVTSSSLRLESSHGFVLILHDETERVEVERMKSEFLSMVSHELKTPITTIKAFQELLMFREFDKPRREKYLKICLDESERLQKLIEEILGLSRLEAGQFAFNKSASRLDFIIGDVLPGFAGRGGKHRWKFECSQEVPELYMDPVLMSQAITNLLSNAEKYSPEGGTVEIALKVEPDRVLLSVSDQGIGINEQHLPYVFEKFYRVDNSLTRAAGGTGLGLANVKYIVEGHSGSIWVESVEGQGSTFWIALPRSQRAAKSN